MFRIINIDRTIIAGLAILILAPISNSCSGTRNDIRKQNRIETTRPETRQSSHADYTALKTMLGQMIPTGWQVIDPVVRYTPENIYELINGSAELYLSYEVVALTYANLTDESNPDNYLDLSVYDMGSPTNAFGIFSVERGTDLQLVPLGRASYWSGSTLFIWYGDYYIIIALSGSEPELKQLGLKLAQKIISELKDRGEQVRGLDALPKIGLIKDSVKFFKVDAMGLEFIKNTYVADYRVGQLKMTTFYSERETIQEAKNQFIQYLKHVRKYGKVIKRLKKNGTVYVLCEMGDGTDIIFQKVNLMGGVVAASDPDLALKHVIDFSNRIVSH